MIGQTPDVGAPAASRLRADRNEPITGSTTPEGSAKAPRQLRKEPPIATNNEDLIAVTGDVTIDESAGAQNSSTIATAVEDNK